MSKLIDKLNEIRNIDTEKQLKDYLCKMTEMKTNYKTYIVDLYKELCELEKDLFKIEDYNQFSIKIYECSKCIYKLCQNIVLLSRRCTELDNTLYDLYRTKSSYELRKKYHDEYIEARMNCANFKNILINDYITDEVDKNFTNKLFCKIEESYPASNSYAITTPNSYIIRLVIV